MEYTQEEIQKMVIDAFDSVNLINDGVETPEFIEINKQHLRIMMEKEWFSSALTPEQKTQIESVI